MTTFYDQERDPGLVLGGVDANELMGWPDDEPFDFSGPWDTESFGMSFASAVALFVCFMAITILIAS